MSAAALVAVLLLQPALDADGPVRLVASGVGDDPVVWTLDGVEVARTQDREAAVVAVPAGLHDLRASGPAARAWMALARPDGAGEGATYVPAWTAANDPAASAPGPDEAGLHGPSLGASLAVVALLLAAWPGRSGLEALRRLRRR